MPAAAFDLTSLLAPGLPPPAAKWTGFPKYNFVGGHNDPEHLPLEDLVAATNAVLKREGRTLAAPMGWKAGRSATGRCGSSWRASSRRTPALPARRTRS